MRMTEDDFVKRGYEDRIKGEGITGRPPVKWTNRVNEYWREMANEVMNILRGGAGPGKI